MLQTFKNSKVIIEQPEYQLHWFGGQGPPKFVVPPHAGRHGNVSQRLIDTCVNNNFSTFAFELFPAEQDTKNTSISDLVSFLDNCIDYIGEKVDIVGICQGGWLSAIYTSLFNQKVNKLALMAAPIDTQIDQENIITFFCNLIPIEFFRLVVMSNGGIQPGLIQWLNFSMVSPFEVFIGRHLRMFYAILLNDEKTIKKFERNNSWYDSPQDLAGEWYLEAVDNIFKRNRLVHGDMEILGQLVKLENINQPLFLYAGEDDEITSIDQLFSIENYVSSEHIEKYTFPNCGHTKVFTGSKELAKFEETFLT